MGASKRIGELMMASLTSSVTVLLAARAVLGSRGSVLPKFERQLAAGGPLTVTHPDMWRFFMSTTEAARLVLQSAAFAEPGRVYVLDMGGEMRIAGFAQRLALLHGLRVPRDIQIIYTGLRPGERLRERLVGAHESAVATAHPKIMELSAPGDGVRNVSWERVVDELSAVSATGDDAVVRAWLLELTTEAVTGALAV